MSRSEEAVAAVSPEGVQLSAREFDHFSRFIYEHAGISLAPHKRQMVCARLQCRLRQLGLCSFSDYLRYVFAPGQDQERQHLVDLLTTNETYFYREPAHFEFLRQQLFPALRGRPVRAWSAACSSGEEVYTLAMAMAEGLGMGDWQVLGTDISTRMLDAARRALYPLERARHLPPAWLAKYCLKGVRSQAGKLLIDPRLRSRVEFREYNLKRPSGNQPGFDLVFLRNVLIYFDSPTKQLVVDGIGRALRTGGYLIVSHVETLHGLDVGFESIQPSIYRKCSG